MLGSDMHYRALGGNKYEITAKLYRDCRGISLSNPTFGVFAGTNGGDGCGNTKLSISLISIKDITPVCNKAKLPCSPVNTMATGRGIEEHTYQTIVDFSTAPFSTFLSSSSCCEITFYIGQCCRNGTITTGPANEDFFSTCMLNICNLKNTKSESNSSPLFKSYPVGIICCNTPFVFNNGSIDSIDNDSMSFKLVKGIKSLPNNTITYTSPFDERYFITPFCIPPTTIKCAPNNKVNPPRGIFFDTSTGDIALTPTKCNENAVSVIEVTERRLDTSTKKWVIIGKTRRDMQLSVIDDCNYNKPPKIIATFQHTICEGDTLRFKIESTDDLFTPNQIIPDTTTLSWSNNIPSAQFKIANKIDWPEQRLAFANFMWVPPIGSASEVAYSFTVRVSDNNCPIEAISIRTFRIRVKPKATTKIISEYLECGNLKVGSLHTLDSSKLFKYKWQVTSSTDSAFKVEKTNQTDTFYFNKQGTYKIYHTINNIYNCPTQLIDSITINSLPKVLISDSVICYNYKVRITPKIQNSTSPFRYHWTRIPIDSNKINWDAKSHLIGDTNQNMSFNNMITDSVIIIKVKDGNGCEFIDTARLTVLPKIKTCDFYSKPDYDYSYFGIGLQPIDDKNIQGGQMGYNYSWSIKDVGNNYTKDTNASVKFALPKDGKYQITLKTTDRNSGCTCETTKEIIMDRASVHQENEYFRITPIPSTDIVYIQTWTKDEFILFDVINNLGASVKSGLIRNESNIAVDLNDIHNGVYTLILKTKNTKSQTISWLGQETIIIQRN